MELGTYKERIFKIKNLVDFNEMANWAFKYQLLENKLFKAWHNQFKPNNDFLPFLPIDFFKTHAIISVDKTHEKVFKSSGTTGMNVSQHFVNDLSLYEQSFMQCFEQFYGAVSNYAIVALLPNYLEQGSSSLVYMVEELMKKSGHEANGFFLYEHEKLVNQLKALQAKKTPTILFGVSFALLDLAEAYNLDLQNTIVIETGGMKGRKKEITRDELHDFLKDRLGVNSIQSEYGMTELLSQAYAVENGFYKCPPWMKIIITDVNDPMHILSDGQAGIINIIDLANIDSCCFIKTSDLGRLYKDGSFEVLGRMDNSDVRGCNLLVA